MTMQVVLQCEAGAVQFGKGVMALGIHLSWRLSQQFRNIIGACSLS
jgi:hypothetical protein